VLELGAPCWNWDAYVPILALRLFVPIWGAQCWNWLQDRGGRAPSAGTGRPVPARGLSLENPNWHLSRTGTSASTGWPIWHWRHNLGVGNPMPFDGVYHSSRIGQYKRLCLAWLIFSWVLPVYIVLILVRSVVLFDVPDRKDLYSHGHFFSKLTTLVWLAWLNYCLFTYLKNFLLRFRI
jgi:hypothetical protein